MFRRTASADHATRQADEQLMLACLPRLRRYARALVGDRNAADDLVQDTLERAWEKISTWQRSLDMRPWLFGIMHNLHADQRRKPGLELVELDEGMDFPVTGTVADHGMALDLESALQRLPAEQREILLLVGLEEMRYEDIATALGIPTGTVMSRLSRARERLRNLMEGGKAAGVSAVPLKVVK